MIDETVSSVDKKYKLQRDINRQMGKTDKSKVHLGALNTL